MPLQLISLIVTLISTFIIIIIIIIPVLHFPSPVMFVTAIQHQYISNRMWRVEYCIGFEEDARACSDSCLDAPLRVSDYTVHWQAPPLSSVASLVALCVWRSRADNTLSCSHFLHFLSAGVNHAARALPPDTQLWSPSRRLLHATLRHL